MDETGRIGMDSTRSGRLTIAVKLYGIFFATVALFVAALALETNRGIDAVAVVLAAAAVAIGTVGATVTVRSIRRGVADVIDRLQMLQDHCTTDLRTGL